MANSLPFFFFISYAAVAAQKWRTLKAFLNNPRLFSNKWHLLENNPFAATSRITATASRCLCTKAFLATCGSIFAKNKICIYT